MRKRVTVIAQFSKPAIEVLLTANRKGRGYDWEDAGWQEVSEIPFNVALTRRDLKDELACFRHDNGLTMAKIVPGTGEFSDMDSLNMSHAGAYYFAKVEVYEDEAKWAELI